MSIEAVGLLAIISWSVAAGTMLALVLEQAHHAREIGRLKKRMAERIDEIYRSGWLAGVEWEQDVSGKADAHRTGFGAGYAMCNRLAEQEMALRCKACGVVTKAG